MVTSVTQHCQGPKLFLPAPSGLHQDLGFCPIFPTVITWLLRLKTSHPHVTSKSLMTSNLGHPSKTEKPFQWTCLVPQQPELGHTPIPKPVTLKRPKITTTFGTVRTRGQQGKPRLTYTLLLTPERATVLLATRQEGQGNLNVCLGNNPTVSAAVPSPPGPLTI